MTSQIGIEKKIIGAATVFVLTLGAVIALSVKLYSIDLPTCLTDVKPFTKGTLMQHGPNRYEVQYVARMWKFEPAEISITPDSTVDIYLAAADVTHGMQIAGTNVNLMAVPGVVNYARVKFTEPGDYLIVCNEYCGIAHHDMAGVIHVTRDAALVTRPVTPSPGVDAAADVRGMELLEKHLCTACHSVDGSEGPGPTLKGLYGARRELVDGSLVTVDEAYLRESIVSPAAKIVKNFDDSMPPAEIPPDELEAIIEFMKRQK